MTFETWALAKNSSGMPASAKASTEWPDELDPVTVISAAAAGNMKLMKRFVTQRPTNLKTTPIAIDCVDQGGRTSLLWAVINNRTEVLRLLIRAGAKLNEVDDAGLSALHYAVQCGHAQCLRLLVGTGACDLERRDRAGRTAALRSVVVGDAAALALLLDAGAAIDAPDAYGRTALRAALAGEPQTSECLRLLFERGADVDVADAKGQTLAIWACANNEPAYLKRLLASARPNLEAVDHTNWSALDPNAWSGMKL